MIHTLNLILLAFAVFFVNPVAYADMYKYTDEAGIVGYTDNTGFVSVFVHIRVSNRIHEEYCECEQ